MGKARDAFDLVADTLRRRIRCGAVVSGRALAIEALAAEFKTSVTPVREALARLSGEGLIDRRRGSGYVHPVYGAEELADLYEHHRLLIGAALAASSPMSTEGLVAAVAQRSASDDPLQTVGAISYLWSFVAQASRRGVVRQAHAQVDAQLGVARRAELQLFGDAKSELAGLAQAIEARAIDEFKRMLTSYHLRRRSSLLLIAETIMNGSTAP